MCAHSLFLISYGDFLPLTWSNIIIPWSRPHHLATTRTPNPITYNNIYFTYGTILAAITIDTSMLSLFEFESMTDWFTGHFSVSFDWLNQLFSFTRFGPVSNKLTTTRTMYSGPFYEFHTFLAVFATKCVDWCGLITRNAPPIIFSSRKFVLWTDTFTNQPLIE